MAVTLEADTQQVITLDEYVDFISREVDADDEASILASAPMLRALANNRSMIGDYLTEELRSWQTFQPTNSYTAQTLMLARTGRFAVRANIWEPPDASPERREYQKALYYYEVPHDHNFSFLTVGYIGPGYETLIYERDPDAVVGVPGEKVDLRFVAGNDGFGTDPQSRQEHEHLFGGGVLCFIENDERVVQSAPAHVGQRGDFDHGLLHVLLNVLRGHHVMQRVVKRTEIGGDFFVEIAGQESQRFAGFHGGPRENDARDLLFAQRRDGHGHREVSLARARRTHAERYVMCADGLHVFALAGGFGPPAATLGIGGGGAGGRGGSG